jgi:hypothetical protein
MNSTGQKEKTTQGNPISVGRFGQHAAAFGLPKDKDLDKACTLEA